MICFKQKQFNRVGLKCQLFSTIKFVQREYSKSIDEIPGPWPSLPILGTSWIYSRFGRYTLNKLHKANQDKCKRYGSIVKEEFQAGIPVIHLFDPNDFEIIFRNQGTIPNRPANEFVCHYRSKHPHKYPNAGIANLQGEQWAEQRKLMAPALLKLGALDAYLPDLNAINDQLVASILGNEREADNSIVIAHIQSLAYKLALESICSLTLDTRLLCFDENQITSDGETLIESTRKLFDSYQRLYYSAPLWKLFETKAFKQLAESESIIYETAGKHIKKALDELKQKQPASTIRPSLLRTLVSIDKLDERDIRTLILDLIAGGITTTSNTLTVALFHLASNPEKQKKLFRELHQLFPEHEDNVDFFIDANRLNKSKYLRACLKESFRLDSPIPSIVRTLTKDVKLRDYLIPKGTTVFAHVYTACRSSQNFSNPLQYEPERWLDESKKIIHPFASLPFGYGLRMCAGRRFSEMQLQLALIKLICKFEIEPITKHLDIEQQFILIPSHPVALRFTVRPKTVHKK